MTNRRRRCGASRKWSPMQTRLCVGAIAAVSCYLRSSGQPLVFLFRKHVFFYFHTRPKEEMVCCFSLNWMNPMLICFYLICFYIFSFVRLLITQCGPCMNSRNICVRSKCHTPHLQMSSIYLFAFLTCNTGHATSGDLDLLVTVDSFTSKSGEAGHAVSVVF